MPTQPAPNPSKLRADLHIEKRPLARLAVKLGLDAVLAAAAWRAAQALTGRGLGTPAWAWAGLAAALALAFQLHRQHYRALDLRDALRLGAAVLALAALALGLSPWLPASPFPPRAALTAAMATAVFWLTARGASKSLAEARAARSGGAEAEPTLIVGAGVAGLRVAQELKRHRALGSRVVGFLDDALEKQGLRIQGLPVLGHTALLVPVVREKGIAQVVLAMPSAPGEVIRRLSHLARAEGLKVKTVPAITSLLDTRGWKPELRDVSIEDLLRREPVRLDQGGLRQALEGEVVLITGAGGSIGSELARQVSAFSPARVVLMGRGENSLWETERELRRAFPGQAYSVELCDIRSPRRLHQVFERWRPRVVFHAAAHKHVPYLEAHPEEAVENNAFGTQRLLEAALAVGTRTFVNISTDKAVNPTNALGATKRLAECLVLRAAARAAAHLPGGSTYVSVRFGNVLGSRGSVIPVFREQIRRGGPLTVTDPMMTRYFMTIPEASQLVLQAGMLGDTGKVYVLDMGDPVRILDLATDMARLSGLTPGEDIEIQFTGPRPGEKLFEELFTTQEQQNTHVHPKVLEAAPEPLDPALLEEGLAALQRALHQPEARRQQELVRWLMRLVPTYAPSPTGLGRFLAPEDAGAAEALTAALVPSIQ